MPNPVPWDAGLELHADEHARAVHPVDPADFNDGDLACDGDGGGVGWWWWWVVVLGDGGVGGWWS